MTSMAAPERLFIDTNVLVYARWPAAPLHQQARMALQSYIDAGTQLVISRQVLREFLATLYRPRTGLAITELTAEVRRIEAGYAVVEESAAITAQLLTLLEQGARHVHDTNLAATCLVAGVSHLLTNNPDDFAAFRNHLTIIPLVP